MALNPPEQRLKELDREWEEGPAQYKQHTYKVGMEATLTSKDLQLGDTLPADTTYEILGRPQITVDSKSKSRRIVVTGIKEVIAIAGTPWSELEESRFVHDDGDTKRWVITFTGSTTATRPQIAQTYGQITGTSNILAGYGIIAEPRIVRVGDIQKFTRSISHVTVTFSGHWGI